MSATEPTQTAPRSPEAEKIERRRQQKQKAEEAAIVEDAGMIAGQATLDQTLLLVESAGFRLVEELESETHDAITAQDISKASSEARSKFTEGFQIASRGLAAWAARKVIDAKNHLEDAKEAFRAQVRRLERTYEGRKEFFEEKLKSWALTQPIEPGTKGTVRLPEAGVRLELRDDQTGGVRIVDEKALVEEILAKEGHFAAVEKGLLKQTYALQEGRAKEYIAALGKWDGDGAEVAPVEPTKKLVIVRVSK